MCTCENLWNFLQFHFHKSFFYIYIYFDNHLNFENSIIKLCCEESIKRVLLNENYSTSLWGKYLHGVFPHIIEVYIKKSCLHNLVSSFLFIKFISYILHSEREQEKVKVNIFKVQKGFQQNVTKISSMISKIHIEKLFSSFSI